MEIRQPLSIKVFLWHFPVQWSLFFFLCPYNMCVYVCVCVCVCVVGERPHLRRQLLHTAQVAPVGAWSAWGHTPTLSIDPANSWAMKHPLFLLAIWARSHHREQGLHSICAQTVSHLCVSVNVCVCVCVCMCGGEEHSKTLKYRVVSYISFRMVYGVQNQNNWFVT